MRRFLISQSPVGPDHSHRWCVDIDGSCYGHYSSQWPAVVAAFVAAHEATLEGEEATIVMETACNQTWTFSLLPESKGHAPKPISVSTVGGAMG